MHTEISPWIERIKPHRLAIGIGAAMLLLAVALAWVAWRWGVAEDRMALMQKQAEAGFLQAPSIEPDGAHRPARSAPGFHGRRRLSRARRLPAERAHRRATRASA